MPKGISKAIRTRCINGSGRPTTIIRAANRGDQGSEEQPDVSPQPLTQRDLELAEVVFTDDAQNLTTRYNRFVGPLKLPLCTTLDQLKAFGGAVIGYPCHRLVAVSWSRVDTARGGIMVHPRGNTLAEICEALETSSTEHIMDPFTARSSDSNCTKFCLVVDGPPDCMKCGTRNVLGYARNQGYLPRFGGVASFDNYGGCVQYILECQGNRRQCGRCWKNELGAEWERGSASGCDATPEYR